MKNGMFHYFYPFPKMVGLGGPSVVTLIFINLNPPKPAIQASLTKWYSTVGRNPAPVEVGRFSHYDPMFFFHAKCLALGISEPSTNMVFQVVETPRVAKPFDPNWSCYNATMLLEKHATMTRPAPREESRASRVLRNFTAKFPKTIRGHNKSNSWLVGGFNQPSWKILVKMGIFPK